MKPKFIILSTILLLGIHSVFAQSEEVQFLIDTTISMMKQHAINSNRVIWNELKRNAFNKAQGADDAYKMGQAIRYLYQSVDDFHGRLYYKDSVFQWHHNEPVVSDSIMKEWKKGAAVKTKILGSNIGYLRIPGMQFSGKADIERGKKPQSYD